MLANWRVYLSELEFYVIHDDGMNHKVADQLLRHRTEGFDQTPIDDDIPVLCIIPTAH